MPRKRMGWNDDLSELADRLKLPEDLLQHAKRLQPLVFQALFAQIGVRRQSGQKRVKVRIAPRERWCAYYRNRFEHGELARVVPGMEMPILTDTCEVDPPFLLFIQHEPGTRWWRLDPDFIAAWGGRPEREYICEDMLELD